MGDLVLPPITWLTLDFTGEGPEVRALEPGEKIHRGHVTQFCRYALCGPARSQYELYKALRRQHGEYMTEEALEYLDAEIEALEHYAKK